MPATGNWKNSSSSSILFGVFFFCHVRSVSFIAHSKHIGLSEMLFTCHRRNLLFCLADVSRVWMKSKHSMPQPQRPSEWSLLLHLSEHSRSDRRRAVTHYVPRKYCRRVNGEEIIEFFLPAGISALITIVQIIKFCSVWLREKEISVNFGHCCG